MSDRHGAPHASGQGRHGKVVREYRSGKRWALGRDRCLRYTLPRSAGKIGRTPDKDRHVIAFQPDLLVAVTAVCPRTCNRLAFVATAAVYRPRNPEENPVYGIVAGHLETFLARQRERDRYVPAFVEKC